MSQTAPSAPNSTPKIFGATAPVFEGFKDLKQSAWTPLPFDFLVKDVSPDAVIAYTRSSYVSKPEFKKLADATPNGEPVKTPRRRVICKVVDVLDGSLRVQNIPRKMTDLTKEHKTYSWILRDGMKGEPVYYLKV